jgi:hypothetical protein
MAELHCTPSTLEVDYDKNLTALYKSITDQDWNRAITFCQKYPEQAATWVVRHYEDDDESSGEDHKEIMWRFLPLHSACARQPPTSVISALLRAYPDAAKCVDDQGMYALHYACGNQATRDVIRLLLVSFPEASKIADPRGMLPIHYVACWGPSTVSVVDMLLVTNSHVGVALDGDGNTALDLALEGEYNEKDAVVATLKKWLRQDDVLSADCTDNSHVMSADSNILRTASAGSTGAMPNTDKSSNKVVNVNTNIHSSSRIHTPRSNNAVNAHSSYNGNGNGDGNESSNSNSNSRRRDVIESIISSTKNRSLIDTESVSSMGSRNQSRSGQSVGSKSRSKSRSVVPAVEEEEKKEEEYDDSNDNEIDNNAGNESVTSKQSRASANSAALTQAAMTAVALNRAETELEKLQDDMEIKERGWKEKNKELESTWSAKFSQLKKKAKEDQAELATTKKELREVKAELEPMSTKLSNFEKEFEETKSRLMECTEERTGLQVTLGDLMEQHETYKSRSGNMNDRLGSLSISLVSMTDQQNMLTKAMRARNEKARSTYEERRKRLQEMLDMEESMEKDETNLENALLKQNKEMEAIAAVIAAARD